MMTFALILLGGLVHTRGASLACPDWPLCYGMVFPPMQGGILLEHSHRLLATAVGIGVVLLLVLRGSDRQLRGWLIGGLALVASQGLLGGLTVIFRLPPPISIAHLSTSMIFFAWAIRTVQRLGNTAPVPAHAKADQAERCLQRRRLRLSGAAVFLQLVVGAAVRHTHASLSCGTEALLCQGQILPTTGAQWLQTVHRLLAFGVLAALIVWTVPVLRWAKKTGQVGMRRWLIASHALITLQIIMGILTLKTAIHTHVVVTHLGLGALLWGALVAAYGRLVACNQMVCGEGDGASAAHGGTAAKQAMVG